MTVVHHPDHTMLLEYATGSLNEPMSLVIATHMALCPECRREVGMLEAIGGALLEQAPNRIGEEEDIDGLMESIIRSPVPAPERGAAEMINPEIAHLPRPLRDVVPLRNGSLKWGRQGAIETIFLPCDAAGYRVRLLQIAPGKGAPQHSHRGLELTLVLQGSFSDETGQFGRGDLEIADPDLDHRPIADAGQPCICLAVTSAPLRLTGPLGRLIDPFLTI